MHVLVCEDEVLVAAESEAILHDAGHSVQLAYTAEQAMRAVRHEHPGLAIVDLTLRDGKSGVELARALANDGVPVIVSSGLPVLPSELSDTRIAAFLSKPFADLEVLEAVKQAARQSGRLLD